MTTLIEGFDDILLHIRNQEHYINKLKEENKKLKEENKKLKEENKRLKEREEETADYDYFVEYYDKNKFSK